jgi:hypothetical protein
MSRNPHVSSPSYTNSTSSSFTTQSTQPTGTSSNPTTATKATQTESDGFILFQEDKQRFFHFTNSHLVYAKPTPARIILPINLAVLSPYTRFLGSYAIVMTLHDIPDVIRHILMFEKSISAIIIKMEIDMFTSCIRHEKFHIIKTWCMERGISFGCYLYQLSDNLHVPVPCYHNSRINAFQFHILDTECENKYASLLDMFQYLQYLGIASRTIVPLFVPYAPFPIQQHNAMGYFFRQDLCEGLISRKRQLSTRDIAF